MTEFDVDAVLEYVRLNPDASAISVLGALEIDPVHIDDVRALVKEGEGMFPEFSDEATRAREEWSKHSPEDDTSESAKSSNDGELDTPTPDATPGVETSKHGDGEAFVASIGEECYPPALTEREWWVAWILDGAERKRPVAPWQTGHAYPVAWRAGLDDDDRPETDFATATRWTDFDLAELGLELPDDALSETLRLGIILPADRPRRSERVTLIDWDDVRDPETEKIHPVAAHFIRTFGGYVEVSRSGEGLHQYVYGGLRKRGKFIAPIDDEPFVGDDLPQVEMYDGGRHVAMTGLHVDGTGSDLVDGQECIDEIVREYADAELDAGHRVRDPTTGARATESVAAGDVTDGDDGGDDVPDPRDAEYHGPDLDELRAQADDRERSLGYHAVVRAFCEGDAGVLNWRLEGAAAAIGAREGHSVDDVADDLARRDQEEDSVGFDRKTRGRVEYDHERARRGEYNPPSWRTLVAWGVLPDSILDEHGGNSFSRVVECPPPIDDLEPADIDAIRAEMHGPRYDTFADHTTGPTVWQDVAGTGKTTTAHLAAAKRDRPIAYLFDKHRKAHEHRADAVTPDVDLHLRGAPQPRDDECARAKYEGDVCPDHGDTSNCPRMCPVYDLGPEHPDRVAFDAVAAEVGPVQAHLILDPHGDEECAWLDALGDADDVHTLAGVHEYQRLKTVRAPDNTPRDVLVDESPGELADDRRLGVPDLVRLANSLEEWTGRTAPAETLRRFGVFARDVADALVTGRPLDDLDAPEPVWDAYETRDAVAGPCMEYVAPDDEHDWQRAEALARARRAFLDYHLGTIHDDDREWDGTPLAFDALLAAGVESGLDDVAARTAAGGPIDLRHCPLCSQPLTHTAGARVCEECGWDEREGFYTTRDDEPARMLAWIDDPDDADPALVRRRLPVVDDLPTDPLVLDATATPDRIAAFYGADPDDVQVHGADQHDLPGLHLTQILDGQYHWNTLENAVEDGHASAKRIQTHLDRLGELYDRPLIIGKQSLPELFDLPPNAEFIHYHGGRGLNFTECDAVALVGAPHPAVDDLERTARLLAQNRDDLDVGGVEHSDRRDENGDPAAPYPAVYRKLRYVDEDGKGRAVKTKHYSGLVGALFRESREKEIEQMVHRIRPLLADAENPKHAYLLTNVPTDLPVDEVCTLEELTETPAAMLPVTDGALRLAGTLADVADGSNTPDGFRAGTLVERDGDGVRFKIREVHRLANATGQDVTERTVRRWTDDLVSIGLVEPREYEQRRGVSYTAEFSTLTSALSVLSSNAGVEVALKRRIATLVEESDSATEWLRRVKGLMDLVGGADDRGPPDPTPG